MNNNPQPTMKICSICGHEKFNVIRNDQSQPGKRTVECAHCTTRYDSEETLTHVWVKDPETQKPHRVTMAALTEQMKAYISGTGPYPGKQYNTFD